MLCDKKINNSEHSLNELIEEKIAIYNSNFQSIPVELLLEIYEPKDEREIKFKDEIFEILKDPDCFQRTRLAGHFTSSAWIVNKDNTKSLITLHKKLKMYLQLGGHCDGDSDIIRVAYKEAMEESGITSLMIKKSLFDIDVHTIPEHNGVPSHKHYDVRFLFQVTDDSEFILNEEESNELRWIDKDEALTITSSYGFRRMVNKWRDYHNNPLDFTPLD